MLIIDTLACKLRFYMPRGCDKKVIESQLLKDLNGTNTPFIVITDESGENTIINKANIVSITIEDTREL